MKNVVYGYVRISTMKQRIERQIDNIRAAYPDAIIIDEVYTGTTTNRPAFNKLMKQVEREASKGNQVMLVFDEVSRMSRNADEGYALYEKLFNMGVDLRFVKEPFLNSDTIKEALKNRINLSVDTGSSASDALMNTIIEALNRFALDMVKENIKKAFDMAQSEVEYLHKRTSEGVRKAQAAGKQVGRAAGAEVVTKKEVAAKEAIMKYSKDFRGTLGDAEVIKLAGCSRNSYYKYKAELKAEVQ